MGNHTRPPRTGGQATTRLEQFRIGRVDLDTVPGVQRHFRHIMGRAKSGKVILDQGLLARARANIEHYERLAAEASQSSLSELAIIGLTPDEVAKCRHVVDHPELWERSSVDVQALYEALEGYHRSIDGYAKNKSAYRSALADLFNAFSGERFTAARPYRLSRGEIPFQGAKSSGFPMMRDKDQDEARGIKEAKRLLISDRMPSPCVAAVRTQQKSSGPKTRLVFAYPMSVTLLEGKFAPILIDRIKGAVPSVTYASGLSEIALMTAAARRSEYVVETDFSQFDASISAELIEDCFAVLETHFDLSDEEDRRAWDRVVRYFTQTPILMPDGHIYVTRKGVPSGSWFTNIIDSMVNFLFARYAVHRMGGTVRVEVNVMGDDALIGSDQDLDLEQWSRFAAELGLLVSPEKSKKARQSDELVSACSEELPYYLGRHWTPSGAWFRPIHVTLARLIYHERWVDMDPKQLRLSRLVSHAMDNPLAAGVIFQLLHGDPSRILPQGDALRRTLIREFQRTAEAQSVELLVLPVTGREQLMEHIHGPRMSVFNQTTYARNAWLGAMVPAV